MANATLTLTDVQELQDDVFEGEVSTPDQYADAPGPRPLDEATYEVKIVKLSKDAKDDGTWRDPRFPALKVDFEVVAGDRTGRKATFVRISSRPWNRKRGATTARVSDLGDLIRAFDRTFNWAGDIRAALTFLIEQQDRGNTAKIRFGWKAFDMEHFTSNGGDNLAPDSTEKKDLLKACSIRGQKNFDPTGEKVGPSGKLLRAQLYMQQAYPAKA
jgi:hypothetical protein